MEFSSSEENQSFSLTKFESMLKTNNVFFFDSNEFENIIHHYLEIGKIALATFFRAECSGEILIDSENKKNIDRIIVYLLKTFLKYVI